MDENVDAKGEVQEKERFVPQGYAYGKDIYILVPNQVGTLFAVVLHEKGHQLDRNNNFPDIFNDLNDVKKGIVNFTQKEKDWLLRNNDNDWENGNLDETQLEIVDKTLKVILNDSAVDRSILHRVGEDEMFDLISRNGIGYTKLDEDSKKAVIVDLRKHRNMEVPSDYILVAGIDILNRSINNAFNLVDSTEIFEYLPDSRNLKTHKIARYMYKRGWKPPAHISEVETQVDD